MSRPANRPAHYKHDTGVVQQWVAVERPAGILVRLYKYIRSIVRSFQTRQQPATLPMIQEILDSVDLGPNNRHLAALIYIGATSDDGITRPAYSTEENEAFEYSSES